MARTSVGDSAVQNDGLEPRVVELGRLIAHAILSGAVTKPSAPTFVFSQSHRENAAVCRDGGLARRWDLRCQGKLPAACQRTVHNQLQGLQNVLRSPLYGRGLSSGVQKCDSKSPKATHVHLNLPLLPAAP